MPENLKKAFPKPGKPGFLPLREFACKSPGEGKEMCQDDHYDRKK
jgi:hypothetical protein